MEKEKLSKEEIDRILIEILDEFSLLMKEKMKIFEMFKSGLFDISTAKIREYWYNYSSLFCNSDLTRQVFLTIEDQEKPDSSFIYHFDPDGGVLRNIHPKTFQISTKESKEHEGLRYRKEKSSIMDPEVEVYEEPQIVDDLTKVHKQLKDPITIFSVLPPRSLKEGQKTFKELLPQLIEYVNKERQLKSKIESFIHSLY